MNTLEKELKLFLSYIGLEINKTFWAMQFWTGTNIYERSRSDFPNK